MLSYDQGTPPGSVQSSLTGTEAISPVSLGLPSAEISSGDFVSSPERARSSVETSLAETAPALAVTKPTLLRLPSRQPLRNASSV